MPHAPCTATCIRKAPTREHQRAATRTPTSGMMGTERSAGDDDRALRPICSRQMPKLMPPTIAPTFRMTMRRAGSACGSRAALQVRRIHVLGAVAEEVERRHQHDRCTARSSSCGRAPRTDWRAACPADALTHAGDFPRRAGGCRKHEQRGERSPTKNMPRQPMWSKSSAVDEAASEIARRIAALQQAGDGPAQLRRDGLHAPGVAPIPHSPPMAKPNRARRISSTASDGAKAEASSRRREERG